MKLSNTVVATNTRTAGRFVVLRTVDIRRRRP
jgi:hypothetical protein